MGAPTRKVTRPMAPNDRYTAIPASLWATDSDFLELSGKAQLLYLRLWTSAARDAAGFVPFQPSLWVKGSTTTTPETIKTAAEELTAKQWVTIDFDAEVCWLCRFIRGDTAQSPNQYVSAMRSIRSCPSWMLRDAAWKEIQNIGIPPVSSPKPEWREEMHRRMEGEYIKLQSRMASNPEGFRKGFETVSKPRNDNDNANEGEGEPPTSGEAAFALCTNGCDSPAGFGPRGAYCSGCVERGEVLPC